MMRYIPILALCLAFVGCQEECPDPCLIDISRTDTLNVITIDTVWFKDSAEVFMIYENNLGEQLEFEVTEYDFSFPRGEEMRDCGSCGDSILAEFFTPNFLYTMVGENGLEMSVTLRSGIERTDSSRLLKCFEGEMVFTDNTGLLCEQKFIAGCNDSLDADAQLRLNSRYNLGRISGPRSCLKDTINTWFLDGCGPQLREIYFREGIPVEAFEYNSVCWRYLMSRPK